MCGIAGIVDFGKPIEPGPLGVMLDLIVHRGPDDEGRFHEGPYSIGMRRLSIIDLAGGHQPISNEDGAVWVVFNGEIYNYIELREDLKTRGHVFKTKSDTEVLVHLYEEYGDAFPARLNGMFAFAVWDVRRHRVLLARDHMGIKPLFWSFRDGRLVFASEVKCLPASGLAPDLDLDAIAAYLHLGYIPRDGMPYRGARRLEPGRTLIFGKGGAPRVAPYWRLADAFSKPRELLPEHASEEVSKLIKDAVRLQLRSDVPLGVFLSGGLDSSIITATAAKMLPRLDTFSMRFTDHYFDESAYAYEVSDFCGTRHHEQLIDPLNFVKWLEAASWYIDLPNSDPAMLPSCLICKYAREHVKVALSGNGGDEIFGGYPRHWDAPTVVSRGDRIRAALPPPIRRALKIMFGSGAEGGLRRVLEDNDLIGMSYWVDQARPQVARSVIPWAQERFSVLDWINKVYAEIPTTDWVNRRLYYDSSSYMPDQILCMSDRASMAVSLEVRVPLLDVRIVEFMAGVAGAQKIGGLNNGKAILRNAVRGLLPDSIFTRKKLGFGMPIANWIDAPSVREYLHALPAGRAASRGLIDGHALRPWLQKPQELKTHWTFFWNLIMLELWLGQIGKPRPVYGE